MLDMVEGGLVWMFGGWRGCSALRFGGGSLPVEP